MDIRVDHVRKQFDRYPALHDVSLDIRSGELIALLGPSGSGKTTLLRLIAGLEAPTAGRICFGAQDAAAWTVQQRNVGFVFQSYALFRNMTVLDNVAFGLEVRPRASRPSHNDIRRRARDLLELVQLRGLDGRFPAQLSGGQRQRVALARALAIDPRVLLLDEPFGALDAQVRRDLRKWLRVLHEQIGHTTVFVTHDQDEALELADRVVVMSQGRIEQVGTPDEIYDHPANGFVFGFLGESAVLPAIAAGGRITAAGCPLAAPVQAEAAGPGELWFRPADIEPMTPGAGGIEGTVIAGRRTAGVRRLLLAVAGATAPVPIDVPYDRPVSVGERMGFRPRRARFYPAVAGGTPGLPDQP